MCIYIHVCMYIYTGHMCTVCYCNMLYRYTYIYVHVYIHICMYIYTGHMCPVCYCSVYTHIYIYIYIYICTTHLYIYVQHSCEECIAPPKICNAGRLLEQSIHIYIHIYKYIYISIYIHIYIFIYIRGKYALHI